jgi:hypothetical protein
MFVWYSLIHYLLVGIKLLLLENISHQALYCLGAALILYFDIKPLLIEMDFFKFKTGQISYTNSTVQDFKTFRMQSQHRIFSFDNYSKNMKSLLKK